MSEPTKRYHPWAALSPGVVSQKWLLNLASGSARRDRRTRARRFRDNTYGDRDHSNLRDSHRAVQRRRLMQA